MKSTSLRQKLIAEIETHSGSTFDLSFSPDRPTIELALLRMDNACGWMQQGFGELLSAEFLESKAWVFTPLSPPEAVQ